MLTEFIELPPAGTGPGAGVGAGPGAGVPGGPVCLHMTQQFSATNATLHWLA